MKQLIPMDKYGVFADMRDTPRADSRFVAEFFEKEHKNVLRDIDAILRPDSGYSAEFGGLNVEPISYPDTYGRKRQLEWYAMASADRFEGSRGSVPSCAHGGAEE